MHSQSIRIPPQNSLGGISTYGNSSTNRCTFVGRKDWALVIVRKELSPCPGSAGDSGKKASADCRGMGSGTGPPLVTRNEDRQVIARSLRERDGVVIVDHGSRRAQSNAMLDEFVKMYKEETAHQLVEAAHMELAVPTISDAFDRCVEQGATRIIISPYFLFPGRHWDKDIPALTAEAAKNHPNVPYIVTAPIGLHPLMVTVMQERMEYCLSQVAGEVSECDICEGSGRCKQLMFGASQSSTQTLATSTGGGTSL